jgi:HD superfamily phosphohydrolase
VGFLAVEAARLANVDQKLRNTIVAAALLHDVGHPQLSHSSEPFFGRAFDIGHRQLACDIIDGKVGQFTDTREALLGRVLIKIAGSVIREMSTSE